ncbi:MAG: 16S rRNA (adenine(1518)-N(6)/adenine(1519)-N(6))-dimethyltransferase RsmA [Pseudomonadales bacterium]|nr:16S rRNA (adenine(1518)-N(6)/adenine(1519)-N(6))-dimethyltransferase RsmA [Pseudomonadales bacterium]
MKARKRFGQHFLTDEGVLARIADAVGVEEGDVVLEIGPGQGALTELLYGVPSVRYVGVEIDRDFIPHLAARFPELELVNEDILRIDLNGILQTERARLVGNLPYNISSLLLLKLAEWVRDTPGVMQDSHFMVQRELAARMCAIPGNKDWGRLSVMVQLMFDIEYLFDVAPESFNPPPKVWSGVIRLRPTARWQDVTSDTIRKIDDVCKRAFSGRRKKLSNALKHFEIDWDGLGIDGTKRADDVSIAEFVTLANNAVINPN